MTKGMIKEGNWEILRRNMVPWKSARPLQFRTDTLFPPEKVAPSLLVSSLIREG